MWGRSVTPSATSTAGVTSTGGLLQSCLSSSRGTQHSYTVMISRSHTLVYRQLFEIGLMCETLPGRRNTATHPGQGIPDRPKERLHQSPTWWSSEFSLELLTGAWVRDYLQKDVWRVSGEWVRSYYARMGEELQEEIKLKDSCLTKSPHQHRWWFLRALLLGFSVQLSASSGWSFSSL